MNKLNIAVLFGGQSTEHEVSLSSATNVLKKMNREKYNVIKVGITITGQWLLFEGDEAEIKSGAWENGKVTPAFLSPDTSMGLVVLRDGKAELMEIDVVYPVLHGICGEDGTIQGLCALAKLPCVGPKMLESAICMDKDVAKIIFKHLNIPQADWVTVYKEEVENSIETAVSKVEDKFQYPVFVKPANAGSSVGVGKSHNSAELKQHLYDAVKVDRKVIVEEFINGRELECAVIGNINPLGSMPGEIISSAEFYSYDAKYVDDSQVIIPAIIEETKALKIKEIAEKAFKEIGLRGMSRIDFFVHKETQEIYLNEINTLPGFTDISMYPMLMEATGFEGEKLIDKLIELAIAEASGVYNE